MQSSLCLGGAALVSVLAHLPGAPEGPSPCCRVVTCPPTGLAVASSHPCPSPLSCSQANPALGVHAGKRQVKRCHLADRKPRLVQVK